MSLTKLKSKLHSTVNKGADHSDHSSETFDRNEHGRIVDQGTTPSPEHASLPTATASQLNEPTNTTSFPNELPPRPEPKRRSFQLREPGLENADSDAIKAIIEKSNQQSENHAENNEPLTEREEELERRLRVPDVQRRGSPAERRKAIKERLRLQAQKGWAWGMA